MDDSVAVGNRGRHVREQNEIAFDDLDVETGDLLDRVVTGPYEPVDVVTLG